MKFYSSNRARLLSIEPGRDTAASAGQVIGRFYDGLTAPQRAAFPNEASLAVTDIFVFADTGSRFHAVFLDPTSNSGSRGFDFEAVDGLAHLSLPSPLKPTRLSVAGIGGTSSNVEVVFGTNLLRSLDVIPDLRGQISQQDRPQYTQTNLLHNPHSPKRLRLEVRLRNHPSAADAAFLRDLALSREAVVVWPSGGYQNPHGEIAPWLAYNVVRTMSCYRESLKNHAGSWSLGLSGSIHLAETFPDVTAHAPVTPTPAGDELTRVTEEGAVRLTEEGACRVLDDDA